MHTDAPSSQTPIMTSTNRHTNTPPPPARYVLTYLAAHSVLLTQIHLTGCMLVIISFLNRLLASVVVCMSSTFGLSLIVVGGARGVNIFCTDVASVFESDVLTFCWQASR